MIRELLGSLYGRLIDFHVHDQRPAPMPLPGEPGEMVRLARYWGIGTIVSLGDVKGILATNKPGGTDSITETNTHTLNLMARYPGEVIGFCYLNPMDADSFCLAEIERCIVRGGMKGIKLWTPCNARRRRVDPIIARADELGVPVVWHTWHKTVWQSPEESTPEDIADLGRRFPNVTLILAHMGGGRERGILDIADLPNLHYDTSGSFPEADLVEYAVRKLGAERVLYASDWPCRDYGVQIGRILAADISDAERELILRGNGVRLLGLEEE